MYTKLTEFEKIKFNVKSIVRGKRVYWRVVVCLYFENQFNSAFQERKKAILIVHDC